MILLLSAFLFLSQFHCVFSDEKLIENANLFNEFVKVLLDKNEGTSKHETNKPILTSNIADAVNILELVEKKVAEKIHNPSNEETMHVDDIFTKILTDLKEFHHNVKMEAIYQKLNNELTSNDDRVQFLMLLLSFATRLALTIGNEALSGHHTNKFHLGLFVLAYEDLVTAPVDYENLIKFRYYYGCEINMIAQSTAVSFIFRATGANTVTDAMKQHQEYNLKAIFHFLDRRKERVGKLIQELRHISAVTTYRNVGLEKRGQLSILFSIFKKFAFLDYKFPRYKRHQFILNEEGKLTNQLVLIWKWILFGDDAAQQTAATFDPNTEDELVHPLILFALKNFAANLIKLMLAKKSTSHEAEKYFKKYEIVENEDTSHEAEKYFKKYEIEKELRGILMKLNHYLDEHRKSVFNELSTKEMLLHFEDVVQIDWNTQEEFSLMEQNLKKLFSDWKEMIEKCKIENAETFIDCEIDIGNIEKEIKENEIAIKSLMNDGATIKYLLSILEMFDKNVKDAKALQEEINSMEEEEADAKAQKPKCLGRISLCSTSKKQSARTSSNLDAKRRELGEALSVCVHGKGEILLGIEFQANELDTNIGVVFGEFDLLNQHNAMQNVAQ